MLKLKLTLLPSLFASDSFSSHFWVLSIWWISLQVQSPCSFWMFFLLLSAPMFLPRQHMHTCNKFKCVKYGNPIPNECICFCLIIKNEFMYLLIVNFNALSIIKKYMLAAKSILFIHDSFCRI